MTHVAGVEWQLSPGQTPYQEALGAMAGVVGAIAALAVLAAAGFWMMRSLRDKRPGARGAFSWFALGFVAAMVVFGGCLMLISGI